MKCEYVSNTLTPFNVDSFRGRGCASEGANGGAHASHVKCEYDSNTLTPFNIDSFQLFKIMVVRIGLGFNNMPFVSYILQSVPKILLESYSAREHY